MLVITQNSYWHKTFLGDEKWGPEVVDGVKPCE